MKGKIRFILLCLIVTGIISCHFYFQNKDQEVSVKDKTISYEELLADTSLFQCGDIISLSQNTYLSSYAIPGKWKHTLFYIGNYQQFQEGYLSSQPYYQELLSHYQSHQDILILDANYQGVKIRQFKDMANLSKDSYLTGICVYRLQKSQKERNDLLDHGLAYLDVPYDYLFKDDPKALYCSELIYYALKDSGYSGFTKTTLFDQEVVTPSHLVLYFQNNFSFQEILVRE